MVMLASYENSQHCTGALSCLHLLWKWVFHWMQGVQFMIDLTLGFSRPHCFSTGFADGHNTQVESPVLPLG